MSRRSTRNTSTTSMSWWTVSSCGPICPPVWRTVWKLRLKLADGIAVAEFADKPLPADETASESANKSKNDTHERADVLGEIRMPGFGIHHF